MTAPGGYRTLRELVTSGTRAPVQTRPATAGEQRPVSMPLAAPRVPVVLDVDADEQTRPGDGDGSPLVRIMRAEATLHSSESSGLADIAEAYAATDANGKVLLRELARRFVQVPHA